MKTLLIVVYSAQVISLLSDHPECRYNNQTTYANPGPIQCVTCNEPKQKHAQGEYERQSTRHLSKSYDSVVASHYPPTLMLLPLHWQRSLQPMRVLHFAASNPACVRTRTRQQSPGFQIGSIKASWAVLFPQTN